MLDQVLVLLQCYWLLIIDICLTLPIATSSLCAADADFTKAAVAAAMDLAASRICSSKLRFSSTSCEKKQVPAMNNKPTG